MSRSTQWLSLVGGLFILGYGVMKLFSEHDGVLFVLGLLIVAFSVVKIVKSKEGDRAGSNRKE